MHLDTAFAAVAEHYETRCETHGFAFTELFGLTARLTGWPLPVAFAFTARIFPMEHEFFCHRIVATARLPHVGRFALRFDDPDTAQWN